ncbi:MAG: prepilin-type N-terminal cleavage/methylation domain-containing protein [Actinobacteria bacterium]|nr:prepilin-type N-terminal cleavage/methylation domain-containing protein [Actinomycetota bacterium]
MLEKLRKRMGRDEGFTLIELLVVMLILGILAAIAIPTFFNQREKAQDSDAKAMVRAAQTAIETYATDNSGSYAGATVAALNSIEPTVQAGGDNPVTVVAVGANTYTVRAGSLTGRNFDITRAANAAFSFPCAAVGGGCPTGGDWGG